MAHPIDRSANRIRLLNESERGHIHPTDRGWVWQWRPGRFVPLNDHLGRAVREMIDAALMDEDGRITDAGMDVIVDAMDAPQAVTS